MAGPIQLTEPQMKRLVEEVRKAVEGGISMRYLTGLVNTNLEEKYRIFELNERNVPRHPSHAKKKSMLEAERYFTQSHQLLNDILPDAYKNKWDRRRILFDARRGDVFYHVAVSLDGQVVGASIMSYFKKVNLAFFNLIAVAPECRGEGIATKLVRNRIWSADEASKKAGKGGIEYVMTEVARPAVENPPGIEEIARLEYHKIVTQVKGVRSPDGEMLGPEDYVLAVRKVEYEDMDSMPARKYGKLLYWYYIDYLKWIRPELGSDERLEELATVLNKIAWTDGITPQILSNEKTKVLQRITPLLELELVGLDRLAARPK